MKKYIVKAYAEHGLKEQTATIKAENYEKAKSEAWERFPEYHQVGVFEQEEAKA